MTSTSVVLRRVALRRQAAGSLRRLLVATPQARTGRTSGSRQLRQQFRRGFTLSIPKLRQRRKRELSLEQRNGLSLGDVASEPTQCGAVELDRLLLGVEEEESQGLVKRELTKLASSSLGSHDVPLLHGALEVGAERSDLRPHERMFAQALTATAAPRPVRR